ncbi:L-type lectin-domain containing receptor kinase VII.1-like [Humulus lupulus]|uniref:L-type lectin-domain containing receptor kinase VII.1-like n=1 Tax=Humulus lupulus TaxID=3486 RepID=UPI002B417101|nr:L-type lectin-domain containing receptor kinase VII.1-like [Humulus lupulus]
METPSSKLISFLLILLTLLLPLPSALALDFVFNGFNESSKLLLFGNATVDSRILTLTNDTHFSIGRALFHLKVPTKRPNSSFVLPFSTSFIFTMAPYKNVLPGHGLVFIFVPSTGLDGAVAVQHLGFLNRTNEGSVDNHVFGVEFDVFKNEEFNDINDNHVGIDVNALKSKKDHEAGYWPDDSDGRNETLFKTLNLNSGENYQVWIDYNDSLISVSMVLAGMKRPRFSLLNFTYNLSEVFEDEMYIGFTSSTGQLVQSHKILAWSFSNTNFSLGESLITTSLPSFVLPKDPIFKSKGFILGITAGGFLAIVVFAVLAMCLIKKQRRRARERAEMEDWELEYWPHRITYHEIENATKGFDEANVIGIGGNGKVYKGILSPGKVEVAVKRMSHENDGLREFLAEVSSLGRLKHRNLVGLRGWCKRERGVFMLVYDYMENGSLDKRVFEGDDESKLLGCEDRIRILKDVASGVLYLHEGWESKVLHRDIKASNVLLDKEMNGRLGDFGLARMHGHGQVPSTTRVVGTVGYMAPEVVKNGRASTQTDVFCFGVLILEVMCGRRPIEDGKVALVEWVWNMMAQGELWTCLDERLRAKGEFDQEEVERVLQLGLLCAYPEPTSRPTMRDVVKLLEGKNEVNDAETEDMDAYLIKKMQKGEFWNEFPQSFGIGSHPTFEDMKDSLSYSMSLSWSNTIADGR